jgi:hypothetical protein
VIAIAVRDILLTQLGGNRSMTTFSRSVVVLTFGLFGCSGAPKYTVDDKMLAAMSVQDKQGILAAENDHNHARAEQQKAEADLKSLDTDLDVAKNDHKSAKLQLDTAKLNQKSATSSGDVNRKNATAREFQIADYGVKATDAKVDWLAKRRKWLKAILDATEERIAATKARRELEKAKLAQAKGIRPSEDFNISNFETEDSNKQRGYSEARLKADKLKAEADNLERAYQSQRQQWDAARNEGAPSTPAAAPVAQPVSQ